MLTSDQPARDMLNPRRRVKLNTMYTRERGIDRHFICIKEAKLGRGHLDIGALTVIHATVSSVY